MSKEQSTYKKHSSTHEKHKNYKKSQTEKQATSEENHSIFSSIVIGDSYRSNAFCGDGFQLLCVVRKSQLFIIMCVLWQ